MTSWKAALTRPFKQCRLNIFGHVCVLAENVNPCMAERLSLCSVTPLRWTHNSVASPYRWQPLLAHPSLNLCLRPVEWDKTLANAKTYPAEDTLASKIPFSVHVWLVFNDCQSPVADWQGECARSQHAELRGTQDRGWRKNISLADAKSIRQHQGG